jgi:hypothetical protein
MNALLIYPRFPVTYWGFEYAMRYTKEHLMPRMALALSELRAGGGLESVPAPSARRAARAAPVPATVPGHPRTRHPEPCPDSSLLRLLGPIGAGG